MFNDALEYIAKKNGNVVLYDLDGNPSIYVPINQCNSSELDSSLPNHIHPAFKAGSRVFDRILLGKYKAVEIGESNSSPLCSIPGKEPAYDMVADLFLSRMRAFKSGACGITIADHGLLLLMALKKGWTPKGNNNYGADYQDGTLWQENVAVAVGDTRCYRGWKYEALVAHTTSNVHIPEGDQIYWKKVRRVGGVMCASSGAGDRTVTGSGMKNFFLDDDIGSVTDVQGNVKEFVYGMRLYNGEIQILGNDNIACVPGTDCSDSGSWLAILPGTTANDYTLVTPGTSGTLHYNYVSGALCLDTKTTASAFDGGSKSIDFVDLTAHSRVSSVPSIMYELGLFPVSGDTTTKGKLIVNPTGERIPCRSGAYNSGSSAGLGFLDLTHARNNGDEQTGGRCRFYEA